ncbi:MAG: FAD-dependent oxidoreductase, partial [Clostridia bacterium]|nr:FAD-dependent oxidoreductase [Clostridia bacterium]
MTDILIIGGGIAGLTAALYSLRAGKSVLVIEKATFGGQIISSPRVDNYPGLPAVSGNELADAMLSQVLDLGGEIEMEEIAALRKTENGFAADTGKKTFEGKAVILATGARHRALGLPREEELTGRGVSYCALCDGAFHQDQDVAVVGGGNSAVQAAVVLSDICRSVTVIQEFDHFTCDQRDYQAMAARENVKEMLSARVTALRGEGKLSGVEVTDQQTGEKRELPVTGLFVTIGRVPDTEPFRALVQCDENGFFITDEGCAAGVPGVWAVG